MLSTVPTARDAIRAWATPFIAYGITLAASLAVMGLVVLALAVGSDAAGASDVESDLDIEAIGTLVGMPFQLVAMALGGSLRLGEAGFGFSLYAPPLLLTATFLVANCLLAKRAERAAPSSSTLERVVLSLSGAFALSIVSLVATRLLAMRDDGAVMHAASVGLFFGVFFLTFASLLLGRLAAHGSLWPRWLPADGRRAAHLVAQHVAVSVLAPIPLAAAWIAIETDVENGVFALVWGLTVGAYAFGLGHLGAVTALGEHSFAWDLGWLPAAVLLLLALLLAALASVAWHLRRGEDAEFLLQPGSWAALPTAHALGALCVCLVSTIGISGAVYGVGGGFTVSNAYWLIPVLAVWGAAIEASSRFLAPALARVLPPTVARRLARGPAQLVSPPAAPAQRIPMSPSDRARARAGLVGAGVVGGLVLVGFIAFSVVGSAMFSPEKEAEAYLDAVVDGDAARAVELAPVGAEASDALLTNEIYQGVRDRITGYDITDVEEFGDTVTVTVDLEGIEDGDDVQLTLVSQGNRALFFDDWRIDDGGLASAVSVPLPESSSSLSVNGTMVPAEGDVVDLWALPGTYTFDPFGGSEWLESSDTATTVPPFSFGIYADVSEPAPSQALKDAVDADIAEWIDGCMTRTEPDPSGCPQEIYPYGDDIRNLEWELDTMPTVSWDGFYGTFPVDLYSDADGQATATYEYDASYGFGAPEWEQESEEASLYVHATVDLVDGEPRVTFED